MAENRNQHYVPQFYLKRWSRDRRSIRAYNIAGDRLIERASIRGQASKHDFYGPLPGEDPFKDLESAAATLLRQMSEGVVPGRHTEEHIALTLFIALQVARTETMADLAAERFTQLSREVLEASGRDGQDVERLQMIPKYPGAAAIDGAVDNAHCFVDLGMKILVNESRVPLFASDHPAALYNVYLEELSPRWGVHGWVQSGLLVFLPLDASRALMMYDKDVYAVAHSVEVTCSRDSDANALNSLQWLNARHNLYVDPDTALADLRRGRSRWLAARKEPRLSFQRLREEGENRFVVIDPEAEQTPARRYLVLHENTFPNLRVNLSFLRVKRTAKRRRAASDPFSLVRNV